MLLLLIQVAHNRGLSVRLGKDNPRDWKCKEYMKFMEKWYRFDSTDKSLAGTLMGTLTTIKFDGSCTIHEHITEMKNITT